MALGRPTDYKPEYDKQALKLCRLGATDKQLADFFETSEQTINAWKKKNPTFLESLKRGKLFADAEVADSLYNRAIGYSHKETKLAQVDGQFTDSKEVIKEYPPDATSAIFWLKNRQPELWREKQPEEEKHQDQSITINLVDAKKPENG